MQMLKSNRWLPLGGTAFVVIIVVLQIVLPTQPKPGASAEKIATYWADHHRAGLVAEIFEGLAIVGFTCFVASLADSLRNAGETLMAAIAYAGGLLTVGMGLLGLTLETTLAYRVAVETPGSAKALYETAIVTFTVLGFPAALMIGAAALAAWRTSMLHAWYAGLSGIAGAIVLLGSAALKHGGFYSPQGAGGFVPFAVFMAWTLLTSALLYRAAAPATVARPAAAL